MKALADKITPDTWTQGSYERYEKRCIVGHLRAQYPRHLGNLCAAEEQLAKAIGWVPNQIGAMTAEQYLVYWNDCPSTTAEMVAQACAKAGV